MLSGGGAGASLGAGAGSRGRGAEETKRSAAIRRGARFERIALGGGFELSFWVLGAAASA